MSEEGKLPELPEVTAMAETAQEMFSNAAAVKGPDFANYAAVCLELAQVGGLVTKLASGKYSEERMQEMATMAVGLLSSIDTKVYVDMSIDDRVAAGAIAGRILSGQVKAIDKVLGDD